MGCAVYPGTFDPMTCGHLDVIKRGALVFDELVVAVSGRSIAKSPLFDETERVTFLKASTAGIPNVRIEVFDTLLVDYVRSRGIHVILRGIRTASDFEYEYQMALTNRKLADDVETVFVMASLEYSYVSARLIREIIAHGGSVSAFVPPDVKAAPIQVPHHPLSEKVDVRPPLVVSPGVGELLAVPAPAAGEGVSKRLVLGVVGLAHFLAGYFFLFQADAVVTPGGVLGLGGLAGLLLAQRRIGVGEAVLDGMTNDAHIPSVGSGNPHGAPRRVFILEPLPGPA